MCYLLLTILFLFQGVKGEMGENGTAGEPGSRGVPGKQVCKVCIVTQL